MPSHFLLARWLRRGVLAVTVATVVLASPAAPPRVEAAGIVVNTLADNTTTDGLCSLREAITNANNNAATFADCAAGAGADTILFSVSGLIEVDSNLPSVTDPNGLTLDGIGQSIVVSGRNAVTLLRVDAGPLALDRMTLREGVSPACGGAISSQSSVSITESMLLNNRAMGGCAGAVSAWGVTVVRSTLAGNMAIGGGAGGAIYSTGDLTLLNSTISGNSARDCGGIVVDGGNPYIVSVTNSTIAFNSVDLVGGGGGGVCGTAQTTIRNSIIAKNITRPFSGDCSGRITLIGPNFIGRPSVECTIYADNGNALTGDPLLGPLSDNGGPTLSHALLPGSPALDAGSDSVCSGGTDQRGVPRPIGAHCDLGAYEYVASFLNISDSVGPEGSLGPTQLSFSVSLTNPLPWPVSVHVASADGTASAPLDYVALPDTVLTFSPGEISKLVAVTINGDLAVEADETFLLNLSNPTGAGIADTQGVGSILNDDIPGGRNFRITTGSIDLSWDAGTAQTGYYLLRYNTDTTAADLIPLAGNLTNYSDASAVTGTVYCYVLAAMNGASVLGLSDLLCGLTGISSGTAVPGGFALALHQTANATLTWTPPAGGVGSYLLQRIPLDGTPISNVPLGAGVTTTTQAVTSAGTCFQLLAFRGLEFGTTNVLCGVPGVSTLSVGRVASIDEVAERVAEVAGVVLAAGALRP